MKLNRRQTKKANKLIEELYKNGELGAEQVYALFDSRNDAEYVCTILEENDLLHAQWASGHLIVSLRRNKNTQNAFESRSLNKELSVEKRMVINSNLKIIDAILNISSLIIAIVVGVLATHSPKSDQPSIIKLKLDSCMTKEYECRIRELKLIHVIDSLKNENKRLSDTIKTN